MPSISNCPVVVVFYNYTTVNIVFYYKSLRNLARTSRSMKRQVDKQMYSARNLVNRISFMESYKKNYISDSFEIFKFKFEYLTPPLGFADSAI